MRILIMILMCGILGGCAAAPKYSAIQKGETATFTGWHLTDDEFSDVLKRAERCEGGE